MSKLVELLGGHAGVCRGFGNLLGHWTLLDHWSFFKLWV